VTASTTPDPSPGSPQLDLRSHLADELGDDPLAADVLARWDRWGPELLTGLAAAYPQPGVAQRLVTIVARAHRARSEELRARDRARLLSPDWFQRPDAVGYACYADRFAGTLRGVAEKVDYLRELGVTYLHLMPVLQPRPGENDGGYAVMDYDQVRPDLGTMADLVDLAATLHASGISLTLDLVLNHVAAEHRWAQAARAGDPRYRQYFYIFEDRTVPDQYEATLPEVFPGFAPGNFTWDDACQGWVWTTFNSWQWDLNWTNPDVMAEFLTIVLSMANRGVDCLRLDAIAFMWKRMGTDCQNQPEVHALTQVLRAAARIGAPALIFKAEAIVHPPDLVAYLGRGEHAGKVSDIAYNNAFMVQIWSALAARDARLMAVAMDRYADLPTTTAWATYLRCHDDIGWAVDDDDCASIGLNGFAHRGFLSDFYIGAHPASFAEGAAFQENPATGDRRISGTAASLAGLGRAQGAGQRRLALDRVILGYAMVMGFGGLPLIYMGDELALLNDEGYLHVPEHADDNRWMHRPRMPWDVAELRHDQRTDTGRMFAGLQHLVDVRRRLPSLHASVATRVHPTSHPAVMCFVRRHPAGDLVGVFNFSDWNVTVPEWDIPAAALTYDAISGYHVHPHDGQYVLRPYAAWWLTAAE
jgi:amylosucrase